MRVYSKIAASLAAFAIFATGFPASAAIFIATYKGTVSRGYDQTGIFGLGKGVDLTGLSFTTVYRIDDSQPHYGQSDATYWSIYGGSAFLPPTPSPTSAILTIGGNSISINPGATGMAAYAKFNGVDEVVHIASDWETIKNHETGIVVRNNVSSTLGGIFANIYFGSSLDYSAKLDDINLGLFENYRLDRNTNTFDYQDYADLNATSLTIRSAIPEPATWAMLVVGFGLVGGAMRRRDGASRLSWR